MRDRLIELLCGVECAGSDRREGGCGYRDSAKCNRIEKLDHCMIACIADHLLASGVIVLPCKIEYVKGSESDALDLIDRLKAERDALINGRETLQRRIAELLAEKERGGKQHDERSYDGRTGGAGDCASS